MSITDGATIIKGTPGGPNGKWTEAQAIQHEPFVFIMYCGHRAEEENVEDLLRMLDTYKLRSDFYQSAYSVDPCTGIRNPDWTSADGDSVPHYIDGPRMYAADGVYRFHGNFEEYSYAFGIDTNHKPTIDALTAAMHANYERKS